MQTPAKLNTPTDVQATTEIVDALNRLVANSFALYVKTKNFHWHVSGPHFAEYHKLFDDQADAIFDSVDTLAERVRKIGGLTVHSLEEIMFLKTSKESTEAYVAPRDMVLELMNDNMAMADDLRSASDLCEKHRDIATSNILQTFLDETERRTWFLFETSKQ